MQEAFCTLSLTQQRFFGMKHWWIPGKSSVSNLTAWYMTKKYAANILTIFSCLLPSWKPDNISLVYSCGIKNTPKLYHKPYSNKYRTVTVLCWFIFCPLSIVCFWFSLLTVNYAISYALFDIKKMKKLTPPRLIDHISIYQPPIRLTVAPPRLSEGLQPVVRDLWV